MIGTRYPDLGRPLFQAAFANLNPWLTATKVNYLNGDRAPLLMIAGTEDHQAPAALVRDNYEKYLRSGAVTDFKAFANRSHMVCGQEGWPEVAEYALSWARTKTAVAAMSL